MTIRTLPLLLLTATVCAPLTAQRHAREGAQVLADRNDLQDSDLWIYNDVDQGFLKALETGKPLLITFR
ncbi:MAG: hypothetical protein KDC98_14960 [Planctomycetes bacterium]|nr:hypothetical protein [Planctomycetota bacterium]